MAFDGVESLSKLTFENKAAVFLIAFEMEQNEREDKPSNANVSSNNSLESDDIHNELQMTSDFVPKTEESDTKQRSNGSAVVKSLKSLAAKIVNDKIHVNTCSVGYGETSRNVDSDAFDGPILYSVITINAENQQIAATQLHDAMHENEDLYLPRSALISTSTGLAAKEHLDNALYVPSSEPGQCDEAAAYTVSIQANFIGDNPVDFDSKSVYQSQSNMDNSPYPTNQLYYDTTGLAYTYDGYQFYAAQSQPYCTGETDQTTQTSCILRQYGETMYVNYVPSDYLIQSQEFCDAAQGYVVPAQGYADTATGYSQAAEFPPPQEYSQNLQFVQNGNTPADFRRYEQGYSECVPMVEATTTKDFHHTNTIEEWSTNDDSENSMKENSEEFVGVFESESGEIILIEPLDDQENTTTLYNIETLDGFKPPKVMNGVPVVTDGLMRIENKNFEDIPTDCPFPSLFVSDNGLITVLLRNGICLEMTPKRDLRLVNHTKKLVAATNDRGSSSIIIHPAMKLVQSGTTTEVDLFLARKAKMKTENITFGNHFRSYRFDYKKIVEETYPMFRDLTEDESVDFLFSPYTKRNEDLVSECIQKSTEAHFDYFSNGGFKVFINGVRVVQNSRGDVYVANGPKLLRMSASSSRLGIQTHFIEASVEANWNVKVKRGTHMLNASHLGFVVSNGHIEAAFDDRNRLKVFSLLDRVPLRLGQFRQRRPGVQRRRYHYRGPESESDDDGQMTSRRYR